MSNLHPLLVNNRAWSSEKVRQDPEFFPSIAQQQNPDYLWIGCSDSRVPAEQLTGLEPGDLFVHRNVANVVIHTDLNCLSALQYAVDALKVEHVIVCGHYGCGGVLAALRNDKLGLIDNWLRHVQDVRDAHRERLASLATEAERHEWLCELNVVEQAANVCRTTVVQDAWARGQELTVHGLIYGLKDGLLRDLGMRVSSPEELVARRESALLTTKAVSSDERPDLANLV
jgi:carbonic anhydrase